MAQTTVQQEPTVLNIVRGQEATITCSYTGSYVQVSWTSENKTTRRRKMPTKTLFLRVNQNQPTSLDQSWKYLPESSSFGENSSTLTIVKKEIDFANLPRSRFLLNTPPLPHLIHERGVIHPQWVVSAP